MSTSPGFRFKFISCKPVKRQKLSEHNSEPVPQQQGQLAMPVAPLPPVAHMPPEPSDSDRRVSTGMVGLPSDFNAMELTCALRGVSLPVLEKFVLNQPCRKPRPPSPPELSPKQLPRTVASPFSSTSVNKNTSNLPGSLAAPVACMTPDEFSVGPKPLAPRSLSSDPASDQLHALDVPGAQVSSSRSPKEADPITSAMPPPSPLREIVRPTAAKSVRDSTSLSHAEHIPQPIVTKQPCQVCIRMRQQGNLAKTQGLPLMHHNVPHHMVAHMACHQPYGQPIHPHMMALGQNNMHTFGSGFGPFMMPINGNPFTALPSHMTNPVPIDQQGDVIESQPPPDTSIDLREPPPTSGSGIGKSPTISNPVKPPPSLIQPTYRKPSPNLIVDVAETCQEKFPFEEVARRHDVPVEKVFDVFAAIIKVPLLRCPTDRRRAGKLATTRVKEYTRTKKAMQQTGQASSNTGQEITVKPLDIANRLGEVEFPDGFDLPGP
ncbi:hypothetical protein F4821DRAFT_234850 [Hypoxylon rubiginosum]|uniref:Uncharacterized protein n=1 Tax=Hypoxylon rubiginosum TaxID=110542 RepID=A0ACC0D5A2_9PEZI|nr:hypothetical protein F4821DRAFT_234850 [Hypoxylon rubiginosum]